MSIALEPGVDSAMARSRGPRSGLSWSAVFGGAAVSTAITIMLLALGAGIGFASVSPHRLGSNPSIATFTVGAAIWLIVVQWISSGLGGYVAGRLRPKWTGLHTDETGFRDTATGLVAWSVATVVVVGVIASGATSALTSIAHPAGANTANDYLLATLFRPADPTASNERQVANSYLAREEVSQILVHAGPTAKLSPADHDYVVRLVEGRTGVTEAEATARVDNTLNATRDAANAARKAASGFALYSFFSMLVGAFIASVAAAIGGRQRDTF